MKKIIFTITLVAAQAVFSQQDTTSKYQDLIIGLWNDYITQVDDKNIEGMFNYFKLPLVLHFNADVAHNIKTREEFEEIFNTWKNYSVVIYFISYQVSHTTAADQPQTRQLRHTHVLLARKG